MQPDNKLHNSNGYVPTLHLTNDPENGFVMGVCGYADRNYSDPKYLIHDEAVMLSNDVIGTGKRPDTIFNMEAVVRIYGGPHREGAGVPMIRRRAVSLHFSYPLSEIEAFLAHLCES